MATRTVRLDDKTERVLRKLCRTTGLSISEVLKKGVETYSEQALAQKKTRPYEIFRRIELGAGGSSVAAARDAKRSIRETIARKHSR
jgi:hypothetical protein